MIPITGTVVLRSIWVDIEKAGPVFSEKVAVIFSLRECDRSFRYE